MCLNLLSDNLHYPTNALMKVQFATRSLSIMTSLGFAGPIKFSSIILHAIGYNVWKFTDFLECYRTPITNFNICMEAIAFILVFLPSFGLLGISSIWKINLLLSDTVALTCFALTALTHFMLLTFTFGYGQLVTTTDRWVLFTERMLANGEISKLLMNRF